MASEKLPYSHLIMPERSARRERTGGPLGSVVGVLGAAAVFASAAVLAVIVQNIWHETGSLRESVATLKTKAERDQEVMAKLQERVTILTETTESFKLRAERDQDEMTKLQESVATLKTAAERDQHDMAKLQSRAERDQEEVLSLRERIVVLETQIRGGSFPLNYAEQQQTSAVCLFHMTYRLSFLCPGGSVYIRWGRTTCPNDTETSIIYDGIAGGTYYTHTGGGANYVCLPKDPEWGVFTDGLQGTAYMHGAEYQHPGNSPFQGASLSNHNVPCAVCHVASRGSKLMIPARLSCPSGWTPEYKGYVMTESLSHYRSEFVCMDGEPETRPGGHVNENGALFYPVEARCGSLPCPNYVQGRELTCVVCTK
uniref:Short-chain collagen C4-like n=1 Tax=Branchiostoma floridae TaxID=7739 RepID=C3YXL3_BRAFL|eukprot:XP_002598810.1 hypothetical protein BRAFLDRAFT_74513 [Branchiostoma floridae]